jgi:hypothetical protein
MSNSDDDKAGYGRPPQKHQFKPGQSGCPDGGHAQRHANKLAREKAERDEQTALDKGLLDIVRKLARELVNVRTNAGLVKMPRLEATMRWALDRPFQPDATWRDRATALKVYKDAELLDPQPDKARPMVLVVNPILGAEEWEKATEGELLPKNPLHGIPGAEHLLDAPPRRTTRIPGED